MLDLTTIDNKISKVANILMPFINSVSLEVRTNEEATAASSTLLQVVKFSNDLQEMIDVDTYSAKCKIQEGKAEKEAIIDKYSPLVNEIKRIDTILRPALKAFQIKEQEKAQELKRQQEEKERKDREEQEALKRQLDEENKKLVEQSKQVSFEKQIEIDEQIKANVAIAEQAQALLDSQVPAIIEAPQTKIQTTEGTVYRKGKYVITNLDTIDITKLPYEYLMIDKKKLQKAVNAGIKINGVEVKEDFDMVTRKK